MLKYNILALGLLARFFWFKCFSDLNWYLVCISISSYLKVGVVCTSEMVSAMKATPNELFVSIIPKHRTWPYFHWLLRNDVLGSTMHICLKHGRWYLLIRLEQAKALPQLDLYIHIAGQLETHSSMMTVVTVRRWTNFELPIKSCYTAISNIKFLWWSYSGRMDSCNNSGSSAAQLFIIHLAAYRSMLRFSLGVCRHYFSLWRSLKDCIKLMYIPKSYHSSKNINKRHFNKILEMVYSLKCLTWNPLFCCRIGPEEVTTPKGKIGFLGLKVFRTDIFNFCVFYLI